MFKTQYLEQPEVSRFVKWACDCLIDLPIYHHVKGKGRSPGYNFNATGIEDAAMKYNWSCSIDPSFLPNSYETPKGTPSELSYNVTVLKWLRKELCESLSENDALRHFRACLATLSWGGVDNGARATNVRFYAAGYVKDNGAPENNCLLEYHRSAHLGLAAWASSNVANDEINILKNKCVKMSAGITKIHSLLDNELVIYDSRVAAALGWLIELYCAAMEMEDIPKSLIFSLPEEQGKNENTSTGDNKVRNPGNKAVRPSDSKIKYNYSVLRTNTPAEWMNCQLRSSWLVSGILNEGKLFQGESSPECRFLLFQLGLFMIGYDLRQKKQ